MERLEVKLYIEDPLPIFSSGLRETSLILLYFESTLNVHADSTAKCIIERAI